MKVLITGASGYLGGCISNFLADLGHEVICHLRKIPLQSSQWQKKMAKIIKGDLCDPATIENIANQDFDALIWTVSLNHKVSEKNIDKAIAVNVTPLWKVLYALSKLKKEIKVVYLSTQQVYGSLPNTRISENIKPSPQNNYSLTHLMCENIIARFNNYEKMNCTSLRLSNGYGAPIFPGNDCWWLVVNEFAHMALESKKINLFSDGRPQRDFIHVTDICRAMSVVLESPADNLNFNVYNLGYGKAYTILELAWIVADCYKEFCGEKIMVQIKGISQIKPKGPIIPEKNTLEYDSKRINTLGFKPKTKMKDGIKNLFKFIEANL